MGLWCKFLPSSWLYMIGSRLKVANSDLIFLWCHWWQWCSQTSHATHGLGITVHSDGWMVDPEVTFVVAPLTLTVICTSDSQALLVWVLEPRNLKGESGLFLTPVLSLWGAAAILPVTYGVELLYLRIWPIIWRDLRTLSIASDLPRNNQYACVTWVHAGKATHA